MPVVVPHEAGNTVTRLNAHSRKRVRQLVRSVPSRFEGLSVGAIGEQRDDFFVGIKRGPLPRMRDSKSGVRCIVICSVSLR